MRPEEGDRAQARLRARAASAVLFSRPPRLLSPDRAQGASTNGNIALVMTEAALHIGIFCDNQTTVDAAIALYRQQAPAYIYLTKDGPVPRRPCVAAHSERPPHDSPSDLSLTSVLAHADRCSATWRPLCPCADQTAPTSRWSRSGTATQSLRATTAWHRRLAATSATRRWGAVATQLLSAHRRRVHAHAPPSPHRAPRHA